MIDHIVFCVSALEEGIEYISKRTGIEASYGGRHLAQGTHNAIFKIDHQSYFEILAPDPINVDITPPRWMGIDLIDQPRITRWAIRSQDISKEASVLSDYHAQRGEINRGSRTLDDGTILTWQLSNPLASPEIEVVPFVLDWQDSPHPSAKLQQMATLKRVELYHTKPKIVNEILSELLITPCCTKSTYPRISVTLDTPKGIVTLS